MTWNFEQVIRRIYTPFSTSTSWSAIIVLTQVASSSTGDTRYALFVFLENCLSSKLRTSFGADQGLSSCEIPPKGEIFTFLR